MCVCVNGWVAGWALGVTFTEAWPPIGPSHLDLLIQTGVWPTVRPYDPGHRRLALDDVVPQLESGPLREPLGLDNMLLDTQVLVVLAGMQSRSALSDGGPECA